MKPHRLSVSRRKNYAHATDQELMVCARGGESAAFGELWSRHNKAVSASLRAYTSYECEDLMQDAFLKIYSSITDGGTIPDSFRAYASVVARRLCVDRSRKEGRNASLELNENIVASPTPCPTAGLTHENDVINEALKLLSHHQRELLWQRDAQCMPVHELSERMGISQGKATKEIFQARDALKTAWIQASLPPPINISAECTEITPKLSKYLRNKLGVHDRASVDQHLIDCASCTALQTDGSQLLKHLALLVLPFAAVIGWCLRGARSDLAASPAQAGSIPAAAKPGLLSSLTSTTACKAAATACLAGAVIAAPFGFVFVTGGEHAPAKAEVVETEPQEGSADKTPQEENSSFLAVEPAEGVAAEEGSFDSLGLQEVEEEEENEAATAHNYIEMSPVLMPDDPPARPDPPVPEVSGPQFTYNFTDDPFTLNIRSSPREQVLLIITRSDNQATHLVLLFVNLDGQASYSFPNHRGMTVAVLIQRLSPAPEDAQHVSGTFMLEGLMVPNLPTAEVETPLQNK